MTRAERSKKQALNDLRDEIAQLGLPAAALKPVPLTNFDLNFPQHSMMIYHCFHPCMFCAPFWTFDDHSQN